MVRAPSSDGRLIVILAMGRRGGLVGLVEDGGSGSLLAVVGPRLSRTQCYEDGQARIASIPIPGV